MLPNMINISDRGNKNNNNNHNNNKQKGINKDLEYW